MTMSLQKTLVVLVLGLALGGQVQTGKIIGGRKAVPHSRPYMVLLERVFLGETSYCDGFLISNEFVMTAAHCKALIYYVHVGLDRFDDHHPQKGLEVIEAIPHPKFSAEKKINDLMLLRLSNKVQFSEHVGCIKLAGKHAPLPQHCTVPGWGSTEDMNYRASQLMEVNVTLEEHKSCSEQHVYCFLGQRGPSNGDSGGPIVCEDEAFGIVSFRTKFPIISVYTKIPDYLVWIENQLKKN